MQVLILILKIFGILLGSLLAICLLLIIAAITVPVRYRVNAEIQQKKTSGSAALSWLFHIIDFRFFYGEDGTAFKLRVLGIPIRLQEKKNRKPRRRKKKKTVPQAEKSKAAFDKENVGSATEEKTANNIALTGKNRTEEHKDEERKKGRPFLGRLRSFGAAVREWISGIKEGTAAAKEKIHNIKNMILDETNKSAIVKIWRELKYLTRHYAPRKAWGELSFGMADPSQTGQILGALSLFPFWTRYRISIYPDFETETFFVEGWLKLKGHIRLWHLLVSVIRLIKDKNIRLLMERIRT